MKTGNALAAAWCAALAGLLLLCVASSPAAAEEAKDTPWSKGVSSERKSSAKSLLDAGNKLFLEKKYKEALVKYEAAIGQWDHPAIRFNIVRAFIQLDRPVKAYENLQKALEYGDRALEVQVFHEAKNYERLLIRQIAELHVRCKQPGVNITVNGKDFLRCPGEVRRRVTPGKHQVVGEKAGFLTRSIEVVLFAGKKQPVDVELMSLSEATVTKRRWSTWKPWAVVGAGAAITGLGALLRVQAQSDLDRYSAEVGEQCIDVGCQPGDLLRSTRDLKSRANLENTFGVSGLVVGAAVVVSGLTLVILNRARRVVDESLGTPTGTPTSPVVKPAVSTNSVGVLFSGEF